jgi:ABC-2 type transport system ATP-binding protein
VIRLDGVRKRYRGRGEVLAGVDLEIAPGRPVGVLGGNGAGKSTLLRIAAGCSTASSGTVTGRPAVVGYLPQSVPPPVRLSTTAYLRHHAAMHDAAPGPAFEVLDALAFTGDRAAPMATLSGGNRQKVGLAQALGCAAGLVVLDEPWVSLDADALDALDRLLARCVAAGYLLLVADHTGRVAQLPDVRVYRLDDGTLSPSEHATTQWTTIVLRCPPDLTGLPPVTRSRRLDDGLLELRLPAAEGDALLAEALRRDCSVIEVRRSR